MHTVVRATPTLALLAVVTAASAQVTAPAGYIYGAQRLNSTTQNCVAAGPGGTFVAVGPGFTANAQAVVLAKESGETRLVAFGFNSIGDCIYDRATDTLYISDNADTADFGVDANDPPALATVSGDTVFAVPSASTASALLSTDLELLPSGSIEFASSLALATNGDLLIGNSVGAGAGTVLRLDAGNSLTTFASGFDFTGGLAVAPDSGDVFVAESTASFAARLSQFDADGTPIATPLLGPTFDIGSVDLAFLPSGELLGTGLFFGDVLAIDTSTPSTTPFASGLTFAGGATVDPFTGRVTLLSSSFTGADEDRSLHRFTPVDRLVPGTGSDRSECLHELYGAALVAETPGRPAKKAICVDGAACDADGLVNDSCLFPIGTCFNVFDLRFPECTADAPVTEVTVSARPTSSAITALERAINAATPLVANEAACFFSDGVAVSLRTTGRGLKKPGKAKVTVAVRNTDGTRDRDTYNLVCEAPES